MIKWVTRAQTVCGITFAHHNGTAGDYTINVVVGPTVARVVVFEGNNKILSEWLYDVPPEKARVEGVNLLRKLLGLEAIREG